jgi:ribonuclease D
MRASTATRPRSRPFSASDPGLVGLTFDHAAVMLASHFPCGRTAALNDLPAQASITPADIAELPLRRYEGPVLVVNDDTSHELAVADLRDADVVGFDTETRPAFRKGERYLPSLVQVATATTVYIFQFRRLKTYATVRKLLENPQIVKTGVGIAFDLRTLQELFPFEPRNVIDLGTAARRRGYGQTGVRNLAAMLLGWRVPKGARTTNWAAFDLKPAQINYAATDAWICRELYLRMQQLGLV